MRVLTSCRSVGHSPVVELHDLSVRGHLLAGEQQQLQRTDQSHPFSRDRSGSDLKTETSPPERNVGCDAARAVNSSKYLFSEKTYRKNHLLLLIYTKAIIFMLKGERGTFGFHLLAEDEERRRVDHVVAAEGTVDGGFVDEGVAPLGGQDLPLLFVVADVGVRAEGQQRDHHVQVVVRPHRVEHLRHETL